MRNKEDIEFHSDGFRQSRPAVNVKVYDSLANGFRKWKIDNPGEDERFTLDWIEEHVSEDHGNALFGHCCQMRWEDLESEAREIWGDNAYTDSHGRRHYAVNVYSEGRSGGWAIVDGINDDVDSWDAIEFGRWKRFAKFARATADYIMADIVDSIYYNVFDAWQEEQSELAAPDLEEALHGN